VHRTIAIRIVEQAPRDAGPKALARAWLYDVEVAAHIRQGVPPALGERRDEGAMEPGRFRQCASPAPAVLPWRTEDIRLIEMGLAAWPARRMVALNSPILVRQAIFVMW